MGPDEVQAIAAHAVACEVEPPIVSRRSTSGTAALRWGTHAPRWLFLHGGSQNAHTWNEVILRAGVSAIAVDLPGHGHSDPLAEYTLDAMADAVATLARAETGESLIVVGHSLGAMVALRLVRRHPSISRALVLVDAEPDGFSRTRTLPPVRHEAGTFAELVDDVAARTRRDRTALERGVRMNARQVDGRWCWRWDPRVREALPHIAAQESTRLWGDLAGLTIPIAVVRGAESPLVRDESLKRIRALVTAEVADAPDAGHNVQTDAPRWLSAWLMDWAARVDVACDDGAAAPRHGEEAH